MLGGVDLRSLIRLFTPTTTTTTTTDYCYDFQKTSHMPKGHNSLHLPRNQSAPTTTCQKFCTCHEISEKRFGHVWSAQAADKFKSESTNQRSNRYEASAMLRSVWSGRPRSQSASVHSWNRSDKEMKSFTKRFESSACSNRTKTQQLLPIAQQKSVEHSYSFLMLFGLLPMNAKVVSVMTSKHTAIIMDCDAAVAVCK